MNRRTVLLAVVLPLTLVLAGLGTLGASAVDRQARRTLPSGAFIAGVEVGGLGFDEAVARVRAKVEEPLHRQVKVTVDTFSTRTTPWDLGYRVDVPRAVRQAMASNQKGNVLSRVSSKLFSSGAAPFLEARPAWVPGRLDDVLADAAKVVRTAPRDADIDISTGWVRVVPEKAGKELDVEASRRAAMDGVALGDSTVRLVARPVKATEDPTLSKVILVRAGENKLYLYENGQIVKSWPVATGAPGWPGGARRRSRFSRSVTCRQLSVATPIPLRDPVGLRLRNGPGKEDVEAREGCHCAPFDPDTAGSPRVRSSDHRDGYRDPPNDT